MPLGVEHDQEFPTELADEITEYNFDAVRR